MPLDQLVISWSRQMTSSVPCSMHIASRPTTRCQTGSPLLEESCSICLQQLEEGDTLRSLEVSTEPFPLGLFLPLTDLPLAGEAEDDAIAMPLSACAVRTLPPPGVSRQVAEAGSLLSHLQDTATRLVGHSTSSRAFLMTTSIFNTCSYFDMYCHDSSLTGFEMLLQNAARN